MKLLATLTALVVLLLPGPSPALDPGVSKIRITGSISSTTTALGFTTYYFQSLYNLAIRSKPIGFAVLSCRKALKGTSICDATYSLPHGRIDVHGLIGNPRVYTLSVTGGTGTYQNAGGQVDVVAVNQLTFQLTFSLRAF